MGRRTPIAALVAMAVLALALPYLGFVEMEGADRCCGMGGTFSVYHYDASKKIGAKKLPGLRKSEADLVASACPGCMMQLQDIIAHEGLQQRVVHVLNLVAEALPDSGDLPRGGTDHANRKK